MTEETGLPVGRIMRSDTVGYSVGLLALENNVPHVGNFVRTVSNEGWLIGVIENVVIEDDPFVRQLIAANTPEEVIQDQRQRRQVPMDVNVIHVGQQLTNGFIARRPTQPPAVLEQIYIFSGAELTEFTADLGYLNLLLDFYSGGSHGDTLIAAALFNAAKDRQNRREYLLRAGKLLARHMPTDLLRLDSLLRRLQAQL